MASSGYVINISSDEEEIDDNDVEIVEFRKLTADLMEHPQQSSESRRTTKKLADVQCPICFDEVTQATTTSCGHIFCLECIQQSIASSHARGQVRNSANGGRGRGSQGLGVGLCPLCRKKVIFKETIVLRMKVGKNNGIPKLPELTIKPHEIPVESIKPDDKKKKK